MAAQAQQLAPKAQELRPIPPQAETDAMLSMIERAARDPQVDIDKLERLMQLRDRTLAREAETAFNNAMTEAQSRIGRIAADKENKQTHSWYATYASMDRKVRPIYVECGFSLSFDTAPDAPADCVRVVCYVSHRAGHTRTYRVDMPADGKGAKGGDVMTKTHAAGSAMSYGSRYLLKLIFNIAIGEDPEDDDGNGADGHDPAADWYAKIEGAASVGELMEIATEIRAAGLTGRIHRNVQAAWAKRRKELA